MKVTGIKRVPDQSKLRLEEGKKLKNIETRLIDGEVQVVFPSIARSHYLDVFEWSDTKLVLSTKRKLKQTLAMFAILPIALGFIFLLFVFLDDASYAHTFTLYVSGCLLYTSPSPRDRQKSRMPSSA